MAKCGFYDTACMSCRRTRTLALLRCVYMGLMRLICAGEIDIGLLYWIGLMRWFLHCLVGIIGRFSDYDRSITWVGEYVVLSAYLACRCEVGLGGRAAFSSCVRMTELRERDCNPLSPFNVLLLLFRSIVPGWLYLQGKTQCSRS